MHLMPRSLLVPAAVAVLLSTARAGEAPDLFGRLAGTPVSILDLGTVRLERCLELFAAERESDVHVRWETRSRRIVILVVRSAEGVESASSWAESFVDDLRAYVGLEDADDAWLDVGDLFTTVGGEPPPRKELVDLLRVRFRFPDEGESLGDAEGYWAELADGVVHLGGTEQLAGP